MIVRYEYRCPKCGKVTKQDCEQDFKPRKVKFIKVCRECRGK